MKWIENSYLEWASETLKGNYIPLRTRPTRRYHPHRQQDAQLWNSTHKYTLGVCNILIESE
jgi:hypothetical protein